MTLNSVTFPQSNAKAESLTLQSNIYIKKILIGAGAPSAGNSGNDVIKVKISSTWERSRFGFVLKMGGQSQ